MKTHQTAGNTYRLPNSMNDFQQALYIHLIDWKWAHITREPGRDRGGWYDAILPEEYVERMPMHYPPVRAALQSHRALFPFRIHKYFNHMASSQAAILNLFLPILLHPEAAAILSAVRSDLARIATGQLDQGFRIEFWDEPYGNLNDKSPVAGTDADIAIAYYNHQNELCLWLIEHKLTENEFTTCGGFRSPGRQARHACNHSFAEILADPSICYYHDVSHHRYWEITARNLDFFPNPVAFQGCPFWGGLNQLWRNQLLALSIAQDERQPYQHVSFSVVHHPRNMALNPSLNAYQKLTAGNPNFSVFTSADLLKAAKSVQDPDLDAWIAWYRDLYDLRG